MVGDTLANFQSKVSSTAEGNFSTSESTHSKHHNQKIHQQQPCIPYAQSPKNSAYIPPSNNSIPQPKIDDQMQNRLFTFMDQKDCQKKFIQNFFFNQSNRHHCLNDENQENNAELLNIANARIDKIIEDSKNKRDYLLKKVFNVASVNKNTKSIKRLSNFNKSRTPKNASKYDTIDAKNQLRTPKLNSERSLTPKYQKEKKLFTAKSSLKSPALNNNEVKQKKSIKQVELRRQRYQIQEGSPSKISTDLASIKKLLRKKKELQRQLIQVNSSLLCKKKKNSTINAVSNKKSTNPKNIKHRKKSRQKLVKYECSEFKNFLI